MVIFSFEYSPACVFRFLFIGMDKDAFRWLFSGLFRINVQTQRDRRVIEYGNRIFVELARHRVVRRSL